MAEYKEQRQRIEALADQFRLKAHLASMDAKTTWQEEVQPRLKKLDRQFDDATKDLDISAELASIEKKLRKLVDDVLDND